MLKELLSSSLQYIEVCSGNCGNRTPAGANGGCGPVKA